ncbi:G-type lectin S-receptor-like serine/threonine-protein kinase At4g27290 [Cicer arietinum]|uniref:Receptor-like serine/threonine-protein kinase n=1 Tax=Cicer arietinum TaxID=3827 RepID=A0A1S2YU56_CICAR|nr:G-type lectin S-receptor-like serine/threonine-protein kinase At4g27290 [Cicer arietinum]XP_004509981.1 G-type lectin S-receptor-like serine/threonine-protein kinase At4g27290 [Cicer arietinum]
MDNNTIVFCLFFLVSFMRASTSLDSLAVNQSIKDGETLVSANGTFEMGFFSPGKSRGRYLGMWYKNLTPVTVVWVANRETPVHNNSGILKLNEDGTLVILNGTNNTIWSSNTTTKEAKNSITAQLLDTGNLVLKIRHDNILWQSFDYPSDTLLPGVKLGWNLVTGLNRVQSSWKSVDDPAMGDYTSGVDLRGYPQVVIKKGSVIRLRIGSWNGRAFTGYPTQPLKQKQKFEFFQNSKEVYHTYEVVDSSVVCIYKLSLSGNLQAIAWTNHSSNRIIIYTGAEDSCDNYAMCGANSVCNMNGNVPKCECLKGYVPKFPDQWNISYWSNGCVTKIKSVCGNNNTSGFLKYGEMKLPDTSSSWYNKSMNLVECQKSCMKNCSCTAYANMDIRRGGSGCLLWFDDLVDMRLISQWGQDLYIRVPSSELDHVTVDVPRSKKKLLMRIIIGLSIVGFFTFGCIIIFIRRVTLFQRGQVYSKLRKEDVDLPMFEFSALVKATNNFSSVNKLGEGGFGPVYKGTLIDGKEVAIKRHSKISDQGLEEFKNEVVLIAKLQHRNLVKLLGCCIHREELLLIYEYLPNKSLDYFIFDESRSKLLAWPHRSHIIVGIARGLLYLHQDSRLRIIHRDLKTSNILLDAHMNSKISDFGLARTFGSDQVEAKTKKMIGTYGYMPPEYAVHGRYSMKSDVFSFGVIILEIISGNKIKGFYDSEHSLNLLGHAWKLWNDNMPLELLDTHLFEMCVSSEVIRCIHVGLLCVQQNPGDRPDMSSVILMLNGEKLLPQPKAPGFYTQSSSPETMSPSSNQMSLTDFEAR